MADYPAVPQAVVVVEGPGVTPIGQTASRRLADLVIRALQLGGDYIGGVGAQELSLEDFVRIYNELREVGGGTG
ncbi:MAG TPA: hypothetical protein VM054_05105 [bacterium]|nr:hypothetical protein [bacterium]